MLTVGLWWWVHRRICQNIWGKIQRTLKSFISYTWSPSHNQPPHNTGQPQHSGREGQIFTRAIKESMFIGINNPTIYRNIGKYNLPHIWDGVLNYSSEFQAKNQWEHKHQKAHKISLVPSRTLGGYNSRHQHFCSDLKKSFIEKDKCLS